MRLHLWGLMLMLAGLSGCQCCWLTNPYADMVDCISDHEHHFERFYCAGLDLNRIGRRDWCSYPINRHLCGCACDRTRPAPCGYVVCRETMIADPGNQVRSPDWSEEGAADAQLQDPALEEAAPPPPPVPGLDSPLIEQGERELQLP